MDRCQDPPTRLGDVTALNSRPSTASPATRLVRAGHASFRRAAAAVALTCLTLGAAACGGEGSSTSCTTSACTITFDRGVNAEASVLGVKAELVSVQGDRVRLRVAGQDVTVPVGGESSADGFSVAVEKVTDSQVVVRVSSGG